MAHLEHIWVLDDPERPTPRSPAEFAGHPRVRFVQIESPDYLKALATAKYLVNNSTFPQEFAKRPGAGLPEHLARRPAQAHGLRHARRRRGVPQHHPQLPQRRLPAVVVRVHDRHHVPPRLPAAGHLPRRGDRGGPPAHRPAGPGARRPGRRDGAARAARDRASAGGRSCSTPRPGAARSFQDPHVNASQLLAPCASCRTRSTTTTSACCSRCTRSSTTPCGSGSATASSWSPNCVPTNTVARRRRRAGHRLLEHLLRLPRHRPAGRALRAGPRRLPHRPRALPHRGRAARPGVRHPGRRWSDGGASSAGRPRDRASRTEKAAATYTPYDDGSVCRARGRPGVPRRGRVAATWYAATSAPRRRPCWSTSAG